MQYGAAGFSQEGCVLGLGGDPGHYLVLWFLPMAMVVRLLLQIW